METLSQLDLAHLPMEAPEFAADPYPYFSAAREKHPWLAASSFGYVVTEYRAMRELVIQDDKMRPSLDGIVEQMGAQDTAWGRWAYDQIISMPRQRHGEVRAAFASHFTPRFANQLRPMIRTTIARLLDAWLPKGGFDFEEFASWFPISVMFAVVGAPAERLAGIKADLETLGMSWSMDRTLVPALSDAMVRLEALIEEVIADRRERPRSDGATDLLDIMIEASDAGGISHRELADLLIAFLVASYDTSKNVLTFTMRLLVDRQDIYRRCAEDEDYCRRVVDEVLRYFSPGTAFRFATEDVVYRDVVLPKDTMLFFPFSISGRDPGAFPDGDTFDPDRPSDGARHIAFGLGHHMCPGQYIARVQLQEGLRLVAQRIVDPKVDGPYGWRPFPGIWGLKGLPIRFARA
jgi:cytochrome P450